jgi:large subunit ribosomal protein L4e
MASARPIVSVYSAAGEKTGSATLPAVFLSPLRPDVVQFVHTNMNKNKRQAYSVNLNAGHQTSATSWGTGRAVSRIPRVSGGGTQRSGQAAFGNMCRSGRMFAPTKTWRKWHRKINQTQRRFAVASALAATAVPALVMARGHAINNIPECPLVVGNIENVSKTASAKACLEKIGADEDVARCISSKQVRTGKGKMRNRRYTMRRGPLVVYASNDGIEQGFRNFPGVELCNVERLNLLQLAPGGHMGRFVVYTEAAFAKLDTMYGAGTSKGAVPSAEMTNADLARIINSDEIQSVVNPAKAQATRFLRKKNAIKSIKALEKISPYAAAARKSETRAQEARKTKKAKAVKAKRTTAQRTAGQEFYKKVSAQGDVCLGGFNA